MRVDFEKLYLLVLPTFLRGGAVLRGFLSSVFFVLRGIYADFTVFAGEKEHELNVTPQVFSLEKMLNDWFGLSVGTIFITTTAFPAVYFYPGKDVYFYAFSGSLPPTVVSPVWFFEISAGNVAHFTVHVPSGYIAGGKTDIIRGLVNKYKLAGKNYVITE